MTSQRSASRMPVVPRRCATVEASSTEKDGRDDDTAAPEWATRTRARPHTSRRPARTAASRPSRCLRLWLPELSRLPRTGPDQRVRHRVTRTGNPHYLLRIHQRLGAGLRVHRAQTDQGTRRERRRPGRSRARARLGGRRTVGDLPHLRDTRVCVRWILTARGEHDRVRLGCGSDETLAPPQVISASTVERRWRRSRPWSWSSPCPGGTVRMSTRKWAASRADRICPARLIASSAIWCPMRCSPSR
jgi:hypothetical protein